MPRIQHSESVTWRVFMRPWWVWAWVLLCMPGAIMGAQSGETTVVVPDGSPQLRFLSSLGLTFTTAPGILQAMAQDPPGLVIADATPQTVKALQGGQDQLKAFTDHGGWLMLWGLTPEGLGDFDRIVGVDHLMRPFEMEDVHLAPGGNPLSDGMSDSEFIMDSGKMSPGVELLNAVQLRSADAWSFVLDQDDIAPFSSFPPAEFFGRSGSIGGDAYPRNMVNGMDWHWRLGFVFTLTRPEFTTIRFPRAEEVVGFSIIPDGNPAFSRITRLRLTFVGSTAKPVELALKPESIRQDFVISSAPATALTLEVTARTDEKNTVIGIKNLWISVRRSSDFYRKVRPLLNIGVLNQYPMGRGGILVNQMRLHEHEELAENLASKQLIMTRVLRNLGAAFQPQVQPAPRRIQWLQKGTAWEDPANWRNGAVPGPQDIACFVVPNGHPSVNPVITGTATVAGLYVDSGLDSGDGPAGAVPGIQLNYRAGIWDLQGGGRLSLGRSGIELSRRYGGTTVLIHPGVEVREDQEWRLGRPITPGSDHRDGLNLLVDMYWNENQVVLYGPLSGRGGIRKSALGRLVYANQASPTFAGGTRIEGGVIEWSLPKITAAADYTFGSGPIVLSAGTFCFGGAACDDQAVQIPTLMNPFQVTGRNAILEYIQGNRDDQYMKVTSTPHSRFGGPILLGGSIDAEFNYTRLAGPSSSLLLDGPILLDQSAPASPALAGGNNVTDRWSDRVHCNGRISDGPGDTDNPLILRSYSGLQRISNPGNDYAHGTVVAYCGIDRDLAYNASWIQVEPQATLGSGDLTIEPGGDILLTAAGNLAGSAVTRIHSNAVALGRLTLGFDGLPRLSHDSSGVIVFTQPFAAVSDLSALGDGRMFLGSGGVFTGRILAPGAGNVYRLGGGQEASILPVLEIREGVLTGTAALEVGSAGYRGLGSVLLDGANSFSGPMTVQGGVSGLGTNASSVLAGMTQEVPGASPFGSSDGPVVLCNGTVRLTAAALPGQPVAKGRLIYAGICPVELQATQGQPVRLTFADVLREPTQRGILLVSGLTGSLQSQERLLVSSWTKDVALLPPSILCLDGNALSFAAYDATHGTGLGKAAMSRLELKGAGFGDVVRCGASVLAGTSYAITALQTTGAITGVGTIRISSGGLILGGDLAADLDFGSSEGVILGTGKSTITGKVSGQGGISACRIGLVNPHNDFTGPVVIQGYVNALLDTRLADGTFAAGGLGDLHNPIFINGGYLAGMPGGEYCLAASRTIRLGTSGGMFSGGAGFDGQTLTIFARMTGPGALLQPTWASTCLIIDNPANDYTGGTEVAAGRIGAASMTVTPRGRLGTGPVLLRADDVLLELHGDGNIDAQARLTVSHGGIAHFMSQRPVIGSLDGSGFVLLGSASAATCLSVGNDGTDSTFYGRIRDAYPGQAGALTKLGKGTFTVYGAQEFSGTTTVAQGTVVLHGGLNGDVVVSAAGVLAGTGRISGSLTLAGGTLVVDMPGPQVTAMRVSGKAALSGNIQVSSPPVAGRRWIILAANGGITSLAVHVPPGYTCKLVDAGKQLELASQ